MNHIFAFINKILYYVYLSLRPDNIEQMPEPVPDSTELLLPLILRPFQRHADFSNTQTLPRCLRNHLCGEFHTCSAELTFLQSIFPDSANATVPVADFNTKYHSATPRKEWHPQLM